MTEYIERELCEYLMVRHPKVDSASKQGDTPSKVYKHWTNLWVVLKTEMSPAYSFIAYCKKESDWLMSTKSIAKCYFGEAFTIERAPPEYSKKFVNVLQLKFEAYMLDLAFDSMTKMEQWLKTLELVVDRFHVDLVRCPEQPSREGEYVVCMCPSSFQVWTTELRPKTRLCWEWQLKHIRRIHWHKNVNKLEVEPGRSSETGEGHFFFTGKNATRLFNAMKYMMANHSIVTSPMSSPEPPRNNLSENNLRGGAGGRSQPQATTVFSPTYNTFRGPHVRNGFHDESEEDMSGTGEDWTGTGASSDSGFIAFLRSRHYPNTTSPSFMSPHSTPPPLPPKRFSPLPLQEGDYMNLTEATMDQDNQYITITGRKDSAPSNKVTGSTTSGSASEYQSPQPVEQRTEIKESSSHPLMSSMDDDGYCRMVPGGGVRGIARTGSVPMSHPPPVPQHGRRRDAYSDDELL